MILSPVKHVRTLYVNPFIQWKPRSCFNNVVLLIIFVYFLQIGEKNFLEIDKKNLPFRLGCQPEE